MGTTITGMGMVVASGDAAAESDKKSRPANGVGPGLAHADFFAADGISPPSTLFDEMSDTFYFAKKAAKAATRVPSGNPEGFIEAFAESVGVNNVVQALRIPAGAPL